MIRQRIGIDTSVLVRLITGSPPDVYTYCVKRLHELVMGGAEVFVSNQVIGEAYIAVQYHYKVSKADARTELLNVFRSGLVTPLNGQTAIEALSDPSGPGLLDRLIANDYSQAGLKTLTLDRRMASLPTVSLLS